MRNAKYLNAREYAEMLSRGNNRDVAEFGEEFLDALDFSEDGEIPRLIDGYSRDAPDDVCSYTERVEWIGEGSDNLNEIEELIREKCPEYPEDMKTLEIIAGMIARLRPVQEYDL